MSKALWTTTKPGLKPRQLARRRVGTGKPGKDTPRKPRKAIAKRSASMAARMKLYREQREAFLKARPWCFACRQLASAIANTRLRELGLADFEVANALQFRLEAHQRRNHDATTIHHTRGKLGPLLLDERYWKGCCLPAHQFIDANPTLARLAGLLCAKGDWNKQDNGKDTE